MAKTLRKPFIGMCGVSEKKDKKRYHKGRRKYEKTLIKKGQEDLIEPEVKDGDWKFQKDGKSLQKPLKPTKKYSEYEIKNRKERKCLNV